MVKKEKSSSPVEEKENSTSSLPSQASSSFSPDGKKLSRAEVDEVLSQFPLCTFGKKRVRDWLKYKFKKKFVCKAMMINRNDTIFFYYVTPSRKQFSIKGQRYIWESNAAHRDLLNKVSMSIYAEGVPLPLRVYQDREGGGFRFDTIDSDTYTEVQKMEYIKTLAQTGQISKILKNVFMIVVVIVLIEAVHFLIDMVKSGVLKFG